MELSRWVGASTIHALVCEKLPDAMGREVVKLLEDASPAATRPLAERFTKKEQARLDSLQPTSASATGPSDPPTSHAVSEDEAPAVSQLVSINAVLGWCQCAYKLHCLSC